MRPGVIAATCLFRDMAVEGKSHSLPSKRGILGPGLAAGPASVLRVISVSIVSVPRPAFLSGGARKLSGH